MPSNLVPSACCRTSPMKDVTARFSSYRECVRHLWNGHLLATIAESLDPWDRRDEFDDVCTILFGSLVLAPLGVAVESAVTNVLSRGRDSGARAIDWIHVVPRAPVGAPILINRDPTSNGGYWDHPLSHVASADVDLRFVRWFDFDELAFRDLKYFLVRIASAARADVIGRVALVECEYVDVLVDENLAGMTVGPKP
jgi:hypothetical protein